MQMPEEQTPVAPVELSVRSWLRRPDGMVAAGFVLLMVVVAIALPWNALTQPGVSVEMNIGAKATNDALATVDVPELVKLRYPRDEGPPTVDFDVIRGRDGEPVPAYYRFMSRAGDSALALTAAVLGFCLLRIWGQFASGRPFAPGNSRLLVVMAGAIVVGSYGSSLLTVHASHLIYYEYFSLQRPLLPMQPALLNYGYADVTLLVTAGVLMLIAVAFRKGRALTDDVEGLV